MIPFQPKQSTILIFILTIQSGCAAISQLNCTPRSSPEEDFLESQPSSCFDSLEVSYRNVSHPVFCFEDNRYSQPKNPPVLLLHEIGGLSSKTLKYAESLGDEFTVYVPLLFGHVNQQPGLTGLVSFRFNGEWFERPELGGSRQITQWLRHLLRRIGRLHPNQKIGVIGNCLTGSLPLALLDHPNIHAVVVALPTLPLPVLSTDNETKTSLAISENESITAVKAIVETKRIKVYGVRFQNDCIADRAKHLKMKKEFGSQFIDAEIKEEEYLGEKGAAIDLTAKAHSTLIGEWSAHPKHPSQIRRLEIRNFLKNPGAF